MLKKLLKNSKDNKRDYPFIFYTAVLLLVLNILKLYLALDYKDPILFLEFFWFCNITFFILTLTTIFLQKDTIKTWATIIFTTAITAQGIWIIAFILDFLNIYEMNRIENFVNLLQNNASFLNTIYFILSLFEHILLIPFALLLILKFGFDKKAYKLLILSMFMLLSFSFAISPENLNINCMKHACDTNATEQIFTFDFVYYFKEILFWLFLHSLTFVVLKRVFKD